MDEIKTDSRQDKKCPSWNICIESCSHVLTCEEEGCIEVLHRSIELLKQWMKNYETDI